MSKSPPFTGRIAMWSGPRNISTAMMRAFENRPDTLVVDEPFYSFYLTETDLDHPGKEEIIRSMNPEWRAVAEGLTGPLPAGKTIYYQKHMTHHMLPQISLEWLNKVTNCFLIRDPREVIVSYHKVRPVRTLADIGFGRQADLFEHVRSQIDPHPPVLDARDVLQDPAGMMRKLCERLGLSFDERMLRWPAGSRPSDGVWGKFWYAAVEKSTGFAPYRPRTGEVPAEVHGIWQEAQEIYEHLSAFKIT